MQLRYAFDSVGYADCYVVIYLLDGFAVFSVAVDDIVSLCITFRKKGCTVCCFEKTSQTAHIR